MYNYVFTILHFKAFFQRLETSYLFSQLYDGVIWETIPICYFFSILKKIKVSTTESRNTSYLIRSAQVKGFTGKVKARYEGLPLTRTGRTTGPEKRPWLPLNHVMIK